MKIYLLLIFFFFGLSTTAQSQDKQLIQYYIGAGWSSPVSPNGFADLYNDGYGIEFAATGSSNCLTSEDSNFISCSVLGVDLGFIHNRFTLDSGDDVSGGDLTLNLIKANLRYSINISKTDDSLTQLYFTGGYNRHFLNISDIEDGNSSISFEEESGNGFNYGVGLRLDNQGYGFYMQYSLYNLITDAEDNLVTSGLTFGIRISAFLQ